MTSASIPQTEYRYHFKQGILSEKGQNFYGRVRCALVMNIVYGIGVAIFMSSNIFDAGFRLFISTIALQKSWDMNKELNINLDPKKGVSLDECRDSCRFLFVADTLLGLKFFVSCILNKSPIAGGFSLFYAMFAISNYQKITHFHEEHQSYLDIRT